MNILNLRNFLVIACCLAFIFILSCQSVNSIPEVYRPQKKNFDTIIDGKTISLFTLINQNGLEVYLTNYGARIVSLITPDRMGHKADIVLGFRTIKDYLTDMYTGCVVGRFANRIGTRPVVIGNASFSFAVHKYPMLHGGKNGFNKKIWSAVQQGNTVRMQYASPDGEEGFPGTLKTTITYTLNNKNELIIEYSASTDKETIINLSNHSYFNLKGEGDSSILDHYMMINSDSITPVDSILIPTGKLMAVANTPFDFRNSKAVGTSIQNDNTQLRFGQGYDHNWVLSKQKNEQLSLAVSVAEKKSGRTMSIYTTKPGIQFYSGNFMSGQQTGKSGRPYLYRSAIVLEPQHFPDSPHYPNFPSTLLKAGETYHHKDVYVFAIEQ